MREASSHLLSLPAIQADPSPATAPTVAEFIHDWLEGQQHLRATTRASYASLFRSHIEPLLGDLPVSAAGDAETREFVAALRDRVDRGTCTNILGIVRAALDEACAQGHLARNPTRSLPRWMRPGRPQPPRRILTMEEIRALLAATPEDWERTLYETCIYGGLRSGEARGLRWDDVDFAAERIRVRQQALPTRELGPLKTDSSHRDVALYPQLRDHLAAHQAKTPENDRKLVFATGTGATIRAGTLIHRLGKAARRAGIRHTTPHDLRRTYGSILIAAGADITFVQRQMGHSSPAVTLNCYAGLFDEQRNVDSVTAYLDQTARQPTRGAVG
jgi:integrase